MSEGKNQPCTSRWRHSDRIELRRRLSNMGAATLVMSCCASSLAQTNDAPFGYDPDTNPRSILGRGYDIGLGRFTDACVRGTPVLRGNRKGSILGIYNETSDRYLNSLTGALSGEVDLFLIGGDARIEYVSRAARNTLSTSYTYRFAAELGTFVLDDRALTSVGETARAANQGTRRALCGDSFVGAAKVGAEFYLSATFELANRDELERFVATVEVTALFGLVSASKTWTSETQAFAHTGFVRIEPLQRGGNVAALQSIMNNATSVCGFDDVEPCQELLRTLSIYATSTDGSGLKQQLSDPNSWAITGLIPVQYRHAGLDSLGTAPAQTSEISETVRELVRELNTQTALKDRADFLALHVFNNTNDLDRQQRVQEIAQKISENIGNINIALEMCRSTTVESECQAGYSFAMATQHTIDDSELNFG